jgi:hypothetical protein
VLLNFAIILLVMVPSFQVHVSPKIPAKLGKACYSLATTHAALGVGNTARTQACGLRQSEAPAIMRVKGFDFEGPTRQELFVRS